MGLFGWGSDSFLFNFICLLMCLFYSLFCLFNLFVFHEFDRLSDEGWVGRSDGDTKYSMISNKKIWKMKKWECLCVWSGNEKVWKRSYCWWKESRWVYCENDNPNSNKQNWNDLNSTICSLLKQKAKHHCNTKWAGPKNNLHRYRYMIPFN